MAVLGKAPSRLTTLGSYLLVHPQRPVPPTNTGSPIGVAPIKAVPAHGVFNEDEAARMRDDDDPMTIEKRRAQAAFAEARYRAQEDFIKKKCVPKVQPNGNFIKDLIDLVQNGQGDKSKDMFKAISNLASGQIKGTINTFHEKRVAGNLAPLEEGPGGPGAWELIRAIVDSGASVPAMPPRKGRAYALLESEGSRAGVEYQCANNECLPNLGEKLLAVMTAEGTLRGYRTQCADVSQPINAVRSMVASKSAVLFGLGPEGDQHLIINRLTGEINHIEDDGHNYLQNLWVVPPGEIDQVQRDQGPVQPFTGPGR